MKAGHVLSTMKDKVQYFGFKTLYIDDNTTNMQQDVLNGDMNVSKHGNFDQLSDLIADASFEFDVHNPENIQLLIGSSSSNSILTEGVKVQLNKIVKASKVFQDKGLTIMNKLETIAADVDLKGSLGKLCTHKNLVERVIDFGEMPDGKKLTSTDLDEIIKKSGDLMNDVNSKMSIAKIHLKNAGIVIDK